MEEIGILPSLASELLSGCRCPGGRGRGAKVEFVWKMNCQQYREVLMPKIPILTPVKLSQIDNILNFLFLSHMKKRLERILGIMQSESLHSVHEEREAQGFWGTPKDALDPQP